MPHYLTKGAEAIDLRRGFLSRSIGISRVASLCENYIAPFRKNLLAPYFKIPRAVSVEVRVADIDDNGTILLGEDEGAELVDARIVEISQHDTVGNRALRFVVWVVKIVAAHQKSPLVVLPFHKAFQLLLE